jgi:ADP-ribose pyrophosphatase
MASMPDPDAHVDQPPDPHGRPDRALGSAAVPSDRPAEPVAAPFDRPAEPVAAPSDLAPDPLVERLVASEVIHRGRVLEFRVDTVERADGRRARRDVAEHPGAVAIVALDPEERVLLVRQYRHPAGRVLLEIPAGTLERDPASGTTEDPEAAARRELEEETGYRAAGWELLGDFWTAPGFATERMFLYLATDLAPAVDNRLGPDEDEALALVRMPWRDAVAAAERGGIVDAKSLVGLLWLARRLEGRDAR